MIPHRITLSGFLSYKEEQEIPFSSAPVWMLAGMNGSGKSSIFDAVTYALFGTHRGGSQNAGELINKESNALIVEFDFQLDGKLFRIKRTLRRSAKGSISGTQQVFVNIAESPGDEEWEAVPDTTKKEGFDRWIREKIGLNYETFTSSVLLLQGKAEKLLDSKPSGRAEVLAGIVDLARYQRLYEKANAKKLDLKARLESLSAQADSVPEVTDEQYASAIVRIQNCEFQREATQKEMEALRLLETQAMRWQETERRREQAEQSLKKAKQLLGQSEQIAKDYQRFQELKEALPAVKAILTTGADVQESQRKVERLTQERHQSQERLVAAQKESDLRKRERSQIEKELKREEAEYESIGGQLRELTGLMQTIRMMDVKTSDRTTLQEEAKLFPADLPKQLAELRKSVEEIETLERNLPNLEQFSTERFDLAQCHRQHQEIKLKLEALKQSGVQAKDASEAAKQRLEIAQQQLQVAQEAQTQAKTFHEQASEALAELSEQRGESHCRSCGQVLTAEHYQAEAQKRQAELELRLREWNEKQARLKSATNEHSHAVADEKAKQGVVLELREDYKVTQGTLQQVEKDQDRLKRSLDLRYQEMPDEYRTQIAVVLPASWTETHYPERDELIRFREQVRQKPVFKKQLAQLEEQLKRWQAVQHKLESIDQDLAQLGQHLQKQNPTDIRQKHREFQVRETTLTNSIKDGKRNLEEISRQADKVDREIHQINITLASTQGKLENERTRQEFGQKRIEQELRGLSPEWQAKVTDAGMADQSRWNSELAELTRQETEQKFKSLDAARGGLPILEEQYQAIEAELEQLPVTVRKRPEELDQLRQQLRQQAETADLELRQAESLRLQLDGYRQRRAKLGDEAKQLDATHQRYKLLAELFGRDRLQRYLVIQAERQIVDYANAMLDRLSGGQLYLKLVGGDETRTDKTEKALELECYNRVTGGAPINVSFLSGSQKFRVAVSLALAIGQYASKQHRPIESVIIDEGFGCLDRQGRQVMIQELQNLRGHLQCILLVSHQEEFADAFSDGYRFELENGATRVKRFQS